MSDLYWLRPEWKETPCNACGDKIWPDGDPDWGFCYPCFEERNPRQPQFPGEEK